ncbi:MULTISPECIES: capsule biosynthesis protein [Vibrio]|uniref:capsular polysaccharide export protein, LipB/KpsS family n=1 Tax=Vibrio TaxID=662 RepID=UPI0012AE2BCC|nr:MULTISPECIES: capsule biosynthesis protein [Vibrio]EGQ7649196.1 capsule biosynthesis protein [Vibrio alginolyticus]ELA9458826.1 capsule biosynthesis protein [Vibrio alginolyticus]MBS9847114.1 capsule biosynthesis protein [Vibrio alginolyticus]MBS9989408.1 capsule biosynthesis protein [Vibrio alginolyticus]MBT0076861.1 capsule biosynthesis protein [Vibrio alginolyticus]
MKAKILFSDNLHFHKRNFKSLIEAVENQNYDVEYNQEYKDWMALYGDYTNKFSSLSGYYNLLERLDKKELFCYEVRGVNVYEVARAELLAYIIPVKELYKSDLSDDVREVYSYIYDNCKEELLLNMSAALFWLDFWYNKVVVNKKKYTHVFTFSGSNIYSKALIKTCQSTISRVFVTETSLTGNDYYIEEKNSHLANNSDIKLLAVKRKHLDALNNDNSPYNTRIKAINKLNLSKNKNVTQPYSELDDVKFDNENKLVTILGQVVNDYSVIETKFGYLSTVHVYKLLIKEIVENTDYNIVFKSHPWEENKTNCEFDITYQEIVKFIESEISDKERIKVIKDYDIDMLLKESEHVVLLNSQSGIEAARHGIKPVILGNAFYSGFGFTSNCRSIQEVLNVLTTTRGSLTLEEYDNYELFLTLYIEKHLFSVNPSGMKKVINEVFTPYHKIPFVTKAKPVKEVIKEKGEIDVEHSAVVEELVELSAASQIKNGIVYFFTDFDKFKKKLKNKL